AVAAAGARAASPPTLSAAVGAYRFAGGATVALVRQGDGLRLVDYGNGALRQLARRSPETFVGGPGGSVLRPVRGGVRPLPGLRRQPEIDASRIGLSGGSQAGWTIVLAAAESRTVRFAAIQSGPAMSVGRQLAYARLTRQGGADPPPTDAEIHAALDTAPDSGFDPKPSIA